MNAPRTQRHAFEAFVQKLDPDMMLTFNFQRCVSFEHIQKSATLFMNKMQREVLGRRWRQYPIEMRPRLIGVAEHLDRMYYDNPHMHGALSAPEPYVQYLSTPESKELWRASGQHCRQLDAEETRDADRMVRYMFKSTHGRDWTDNVFIYAPAG